MESRLEDKFGEVYHDPIIICDIPNVKESREEAIRLWGVDIGSQEPSYIPEINDRIRVIQPRPGLDLKSDECVLSALENRLLFSNAWGLITVRKLDVMNFLPRDSFVFGLDEKRRLHWAKYVGYLIPVLYKVSAGVYKYIVEPFNALVDQDEFLAFFMRQKAKVSN